VEAPGSPPLAERAAAFEAHRSVLRGLAYRMLGSLADADDVVQDTYLRWQAADTRAIASPRAWLLTTCTRLAIDELRSARRRREQYVGPWLPEPVVQEPGGAGPAEIAELAETLTTAFLLLLERLPPAERAAFVLHEILELPHAEVGRILGKSDAACRQMLARARRRLPGSPRPGAPPARVQAHRAQAFFAAARAGRLEEVMALLADAAEMRSDGGGRVVSARRVVTGRARVARFIRGVFAKQPPGVQVRAATINARPGLVAFHDRRAVATIGLDFDPAGLVRAVYVVRNPEKLRRLQPGPG
jgi:RNA polymerase sigma-70 factor (ECF subfamily)